MLNRPSLFEVVARKPNRGNESVPLLSANPTDGTLSQTIATRNSFHLQVLAFMLRLTTPDVHINLRSAKAEGAMNDDGFFGLPRQCAR